jgi:hypothetical protein
VSKNYVQQAYQVLCIIHNKNIELGKNVIVIGHHTLEHRKIHAVRADQW